MVPPFYQRGETMKHCSFLCKGWWPFVLFPLLLLLPLLFFQWQAIEMKVAANAQQQLDDRGHSWAEAITYQRGRDVLIAGTAPGKAAVDAARDDTLVAPGVRVVDFVQDNIAPPEQVPAQFRAIVTGDTVVLRGTLGTQAGIDRLLAQAKQAFGPANVVNKLSIADNVAELDPTPGLFVTLASGGKLGTLTATVTGDRIQLDGDVLGETTKSDMSRRLANVFPGGITNDLSVTAPVERDQCEDLVGNLLANGKINFQSGEATITEDSFDLLKQISDTAKRCPKAQFEIAGHTDSTGDAELNMNLSARRAQAVLDFLIEQGLSAQQFTAVGYGAEQPIASNDNSQGRASNRRIEFRLKN